MPSTLQVQISHILDAVIIKLIGEARLDVEDAAFQLDRVVVHHPKTIFIDVTELSFLSSIGMSLLINLRRIAVKAGGSVKLVGLRPMIRESLEHARLLELFEVLPAMPADSMPAAAAANSP